MPPSAIIDSDIAELNNALYYVIESDGIWKTDNLTTAGAATWSEVWTDANFVGDEFGGLLRVRVAPATAGLVYVIGWGKTGGDAKPFVLRSSNGGLTWAQTWIDEVLTEKAYTVTHRSGSFVHTAPGTHSLSIPHVRTGDAGSTHNPWAMAWYYTTTPDAGDHAVELSAAADTIHDFSQTTIDISERYGTANDLLGGPDQTTAVGWMTDYFGSPPTAAGGTTKMTKAADNIMVKFLTTFGAFGFTANCDSWVFWNQASVIGAKAFDIARSNSNWLYLGLENKIIKSEDGGFTWANWYTAAGANDICVDPQIAGAVYTWTTDGELLLIVAGVMQSLLDTETALDVPLRLARALNSGKLWTLTNGSMVKMRNLGVLTTQSASHTAATGLHAYLGDKLIFTDGVNIWISNDGGTTWSAKKGGWSTYAIGVNAHRMV